MKQIPIALAAGALLAATVHGPSVAQSGQALAKPGCSQESATPATPSPSKGAGSGTEPGNSGSTGWSGSGLGGAYSGTSPSGPVASSPSYHPVTAKGLDPIKGMPQSQKTSC